MSPHRPLSIVPMQSVSTSPQVEVTNVSSSQSAYDGEDAVQEPVLMHAMNAHVSVLPPPLTLTQGPLLITLERWSDGAHAALWPEARFYGYGESDAEAIDALAENIKSFIESVLIDNVSGKIGGAVLRQWEVIESRIDTSRIRHL